MPINNDFIKALVVEDDAGNRESMRVLLESSGISPKNVVLVEDENAAYEALLGQVAKGHRERFHVMLCGMHLKSDDDGANLMREIKSGITNTPDADRPYIIAVSGKPQSPDIVEDVEQKKIADVFLSRTSPDFSAKLGEHIELLKSKIQEQLKLLDLNVAIEIAKLSQGKSEAEIATAQTPAGDREAHPEDTIDPPTEPTPLELPSKPKPEPKEIHQEDIGANWYENLGKMLDLRKTMSERLVAVLDLDGTLKKPSGFAMEDLVEEFIKIPMMGERGSQSEYDKWLRGLSEDQQQKNRAALEELKSMFKDYRDGKYSEDKYELFLTQSDDLYAKMLEGVLAKPVFEFAEKVCIRKVKEDDSLYSHAIPIVKLLKKVGIVPTLISGAPAEAIAGFRKALGIDERCYPMELNIDQETGRYTGNVRHHTGTGKVKNKMIERIMENKNRIVFAAGDQKSDQPLLAAALSYEDDGVAGIAFYFGNNVADVRGFNKAYSERRANDIPRLFWKSKAILDLLIDRLHFMANDERNRILPANFSEMMNTMILERSKIIRTLYTENPEDLDG